MTKDQAYNGGFCSHCAAFAGGRQRCGVLSEDKNLCQLDLDTQQRWIVEHGLGNKNKMGVPNGKTN